ncbi:MAG: class I SAM-dependent methyltransferase [Candidatus Shapirobacteria bacterium]|jgi:2-polyprenyl-3-methyl-5-hydroxy-6-metoxy-1,4-benzoquinol methylase|nr:class I SAM-dependent methyltransferase [Candidatus Shapirobacteria bacterium]
MSNKYLTKKTINLFPLFWPRFYVYLRSIVLPLFQIESLLPPKGSILDVGCGYGFTSIFFALKNKKRQIFGSEIESKRVLLAKKVSKSISNISFETSDLINKNKSKFDVVLAIDLLHHINFSQKKTFLKDASLKLKPKGLLIIKDIDTTPIHKYFWNYIHDSIMTKFSKLYFLSSNQIENLLIKNNFKIIKKGKYKNLFYPHIFYVCQKNF